jgi:HK97 family phage portal protein
MWPFRSKPQQTETRGQSLDVLSAAYGFRVDKTAVSPHMAENLAVTLSCIGAICTGLASLPLYLYRTDANGRSVVTDHPVARLLRRPNRYQSWPSYLETTLASALLAGNGVSAIEWDARGSPVELRPVQWTNCVVAMMPSQRLAYDVTFPTLYGPTSPPARYFDDSVLHIKDRSDDGLIGRSRLSRAPDVVGNAASLQAYSSGFWEDGCAPSGTLKHPKTLSDDASKRLKADFDANRGGTRRKLVVLEEGMEFSLMSITPEAAELLESRKFSVQELCRLWGVPPPIVGDYEHATLTNAREAARWFATFTLSGWARKVEDEIARMLLPADGSLCVEFDMGELLRGDPEVQASSAVAAVAGGLITANEARLALGYPKHADGDVLRMLPGEPASPSQQPAPPMPTKPNGEMPGQDMPTMQ